MAEVKNSELMGLSNAIEMLASKRFDDTLFRIRIAKIRRTLRLQRELIGPLEKELAKEFALFEDGQLVTDRNGNPVVDPEKLQEWRQKHDDLLEDTFEVKETIHVSALEGGKEIDGDNRVRQWIPEPIVYDDLLPILIGLDTR